MSFGKSKNRSSRHSQTELTRHSQTPSSRSPQTGFWLLLLIMLVPAAFCFGWVARGASDGVLPGISDSVESDGSGLPPGEADVELTVELEMLNAEKKLLEDEIANASGSGLAAIAKENLKSINEEIAQTEQKLKNAAATTTGTP